MPKGIGLMDSWPIHVSQRDGIWLNIFFAGPPRLGNLLAGVAPAARPPGYFVIE
jgi:hypothetical protein